MPLDSSVHLHAHLGGKVGQIEFLVRVALLPHLDVKQHQIIRAPDGAEHPVHVKIVQEEPFFRVLLHGFLFHGTALLLSCIPRDVVVGAAQALVGRTDDLVGAEQLFDAVGRSSP